MCAYIIIEMVRRQNGTGMLSNVKDLVLRNKLISQGLGLVPHPLFQLASKGTGMLGLGRKRKPARRTQRGKGIFSSILSEIGGGLGGGLGNLGRGIFGRGRKPKRRTIAL